MSFTNRTDKLNEVWDKMLNEESEYQKFFLKKLKEAGYSSPADIPEDKKKEFFNMIEKEWKGDKK
jgi:hypothetical protein